MPRTEHEKMDARKRLQAEVNLLLDQYSRRFKQAGEDFIDVEWDRCRATGQPFFPAVVAQMALDHSKQMYVAGELDTTVVPALETDAETAPED